MREENVIYFTQEEAEFVHLLISIGTRKNIAKVLVFLAKTPEATSFTIERGTGLRQPEVSLVLGHLMDQGWIKSHECKGDRKGRPMKMYTLVKSMDEILDYIENKKKTEVSNQAGLMQKLREYVDSSHDTLAISLTSFSMFLYSLCAWEEISLLFTF